MKRNLLVVSSAQNVRKDFSFAYSFQRHKPEVTQVKLTSLVLQNKLSEALPMMTNWFCLLRGFSDLVSVCV